jgi:hypothetical protein
MRGEILTHSVNYMTTDNKMKLNKTDNKMKLNKTEYEFLDFITVSPPVRILDYLKTQGIRFEYDDEQLAKQHKEFLRKEYLDFGCNECCLNDDNKEYSHQEMRWVYDCLCGKTERLVDIHKCKQCGHEIPEIILCA